MTLPRLISDGVLQHFATIPITLFRPLSFRISQVFLTLGGPGYFDRSERHSTIIDSFHQAAFRNRYTIQNRNPSYSAAKLML